jgi:hypothetical protein
VDARAVARHDTQQAHAALVVFGAQFEVADDE